MKTIRNRGVSDSLLLIMSTLLIGTACAQDTIASPITLTSLKQNRNMSFPPKSGSSLEADKLDAIFRKMIEKDLVPGLVVYARRGNHIYHQAFGTQNVATVIPMSKDAIFRFYSNSKVFGGAIALDLQAEGKLSLEDMVSRYIPSFDRQWSVLKPNGDGQHSIEVFDALTQETIAVEYDLLPSNRPMRIKHLISETSGIGYDFLGGLTTLACNTLRQKAALPETYFTSSNIVGTSLTVEEFSDLIAKVGILQSEPGDPSYGHGGTLFGRVVEIITGLRLSTYLSNKIFKPLEMEADFFFADGDERTSRLAGMYAPLPSLNGDSYTMVPCEETVPGSVNHINHISGPRKCESLDTGLCMPVESYAKFFDMLLNEGRSPDGQRVLSKSALRSLTHDQTDLGDFSYGWSVQPCSITTEKGTRVTTLCQWGGYASTKAYLFPDEDTYVILGQQMMVYTPARKLVKQIVNKQVKNTLAALLGDVAWGRQLKAPTE